ncbi:MAG: YafY family protein [Alphaproteobacteria bacterium]|nr:YafY family protein [Alphaproteobacteria bacterium]
MRRADRLFQIVQHLRGGRLTTARQLSERLEVSERTIYRDIADLIGAGVPIDGEAGIGYLMREGFDLPPMMFSKDEVVALVAGARLISAWGGADMAKAAQEALVKIETVLPPSARDHGRQVQIHAFAPPQINDDYRKRLDDLERAVESKTRLSFDYEDAAGDATNRTVRPLGLWYWGRVWTLVGWCELRNDFRMFRLDRISAMKPDGKFTHEPGKSLTDFYRQMELEGRERPT